MVLRSIPFVPGPEAIVITPNGKTAYTAVQHGCVARHHADQRSHQQDTDAGRDRPGPFCLAITPDGGTAYVTNYGDGSADTVTPIDTATNKAGKAIKVGPGPIALAITPVSATAPPTSCINDSAQF